MGEILQLVITLWAAAVIVTIPIVAAFVSHELFKKSVKRNEKSRDEIIRELETDPDFVRTMQKIDKCGQLIKTNGELWKLIISMEKRRMGQAFQSPSKPPFD